MKTNHNLIERWRECNLESPPYLFPDDRLENISRFSVTYNSFDEYANSIEFGASSAKLHTGLLPLPYVGDLAEASIFILMLNPGLSPGDYSAEENSEFRQAHITNLKQQNINEKYPFIF